MGKGINYTVVYDTNGGEDKKSEVFEYGKIEKIDKPTKEFKVNITNSASGTLSVESVSKAQTFAGWTADSNLNTTTAEYGSSTLLGTKWTDSNTKAVATYFRNLRKTSGTVTLTANWKPVAVTLPTITKTGYTCGYSTSSSGSISYSSGGSYTPSETESSKTLYTVCEATTYTVEYYTYDGASKLGTSTHDYGVSKALTTMSTLGGSAPSSKVSFYGWATSANSTTRAYSDGESVTSLTSTSGGTVKLYAIWRSDGVALTYKSGINSATSSTSSTYYYYNGATSVAITTGAPASITNWSALGWRDDTTPGAKEYSSNTSSSFSQSTTLYGVYSRSYTANFYSGASKATTTKVDSSPAYYNSSEASTPTTVSITTASATNSTDISNWTELGWRDDKAADAKEYSYGAAVTVAFGTDFYGVYSRTLTVSYNGNSNTGGSTSNTTKTVYLNSNSTTTSSQAVTLANNGFTRTGYTFSKWVAGSTSGTEYSAGASYTPGVAYNASTFGTTMYAKWTANSYTVEYYTYDGATKLGNSTHTYAASKALTTMSSLGGSAPSSKVSFYGWATSANSTTKAYSDGESVTSLTSTNGGTVKLYAIWRSDGVALTYKSGVNSATSSTSSTYYYYNVSII